MPKLNVKNLKNEQVGEIDLSDSIFGAEVKEHLLHEVVRMQLNRRRSGTACAKERNAVSGGGSKPYRQKGTGRARQGTITAPNHVGGGIVFGPRPRSYEFTPPKKVRRGAMVSALSLAAKEDRLIIVEDFELQEIKTRFLAEALKGLGVEKGLLVDGKDNETLTKSARNLAKCSVLPPEGLNVYDILRHDHLVISKSAVLQLQEKLEKPVRARRAS